jgi:2-keto-4-pentenoate hydratase/2-oxohepta-3-ene-1,7-dioic acid hydratase in catechol pathway
MRVASVEIEGQQTYGIVDSEGIKLAKDEFTGVYPDLRSVLAAGQLAQMPSKCHAEAINLADIQLLPPIPEPSKILCVGLNYRKPYPVAGQTVQSDNIVIFGRHGDTLVGHNTPLEMPRGEARETYDFEGEIVAVIGKTCRHSTEEEALSYVAGYACMNEGSVRAWQKHSVHAGKNFHASGSWGPWLTTSDEAGPVEAMRLETRVNGAVMQQSTGAEMIHPLPKLIAYISHMIRLNPGDVIATGSPDGTGGSRIPPAFLQPGDVVVVESPTLGTLRNQIAG